VGTSKKISLLVKKGKQMYFFWVQAGKLFFGGAEEGNTFLKINFNNKYFLQQIIPL